MRTLAEPNVPNQTHHVSLTDPDGNSVGLMSVDSQGNVATPPAIAENPVPRTALKTSSGGNKYSDFDYPWSPIASDNWAGGRGNLDFDRDSTRFFDSFRANTMFGEMYCAPQENYTLGIRNHNSDMSGSMRWHAMLSSGSGKYISRRFAPSTVYSAGIISLWIDKVGTPPTELTVTLCSDSSGDPGSVLKTVTLSPSSTLVPDTHSAIIDFTLPSVQSLSASYYQIVVYSTGGTDENHWCVGTNPVGTNVTKQSADNSTWSVATFDMYYRIRTVDLDKKFILFQYREALYCLCNTESGAPELWMNGWRFMADSNVANMLKIYDGTASWVSNAMAGAIAVLESGSGSTEDQRWRAITENTNNEILCDATWNVAHSTTTSVVIKNTDYWQKLTSALLTAKVTDVFVANNIVYFSMGDDVMMVEMQWNTTTAVHDFDAQTSVKTSILRTNRDTTNGLELWRANNLDGATPRVRSLSKATIGAYSADLSFGTTADKVFTEDIGKINGLIEYGDTSKYLWIFCEGMVYTITSAGKLDPVSLQELRTMAMESNGRTSLVHNGNLYFNWGYGMERYYNGALDDIGMNRDEGLPEERQGVVTSILGYPGRLFVSVDAGATGYSTVYMLDPGYAPGAGFHEVYRAPYGQRIKNMFYQNMPSTALDRLWIQVGEDLVWLGFKTAVMNARLNSSSRYTHEFHVITGYMYSGLYDSYKLYYLLKLFTENLAEDAQFVEAYYQVDQETEWTKILEPFSVSPTQEELVSSDGDNVVPGKRLRLMIKGKTTDNTKTPIVRAIVLETIARSSLKYGYTFSTRFKDDDVDLLGQPEPMTAQEKISLMKYWAENLTPLRMRCVLEEYDNTLVFLDPTPNSPIARYIPNYVGKLTLVGVHKGHDDIASN